MNTIEARQEMRLMILIEKLERMGPPRGPNTRYQAKGSSSKAELSSYRHYRADRLLLEFINDERVTEAFDAIDKTYG